MPIDATGPGAIRRDRKPGRIRQRRVSRRLGLRLTFICVMTAFLLGVVMALVQIWFDSIAHVRELDRNVAELISVVEEPAAEAAYNIDSQLAQRVTDGLNAYRSVYRSRILLPAVPPEDQDIRLGEALGDRAEDPLRPLTDFIFNPTRYYERDLRVPGLDEPIGRLEVYVDTFPSGLAFLTRAELIIISGVVRAGLYSLTLLVIFYLYLTRPLGQIVSQLGRVNPRAPETTRLPQQKRHQGDELGEMIASVNGLLKSIEVNLDKRQRAEANASYLQQFDRLTSLPNRTLFYDRLTQTIQLARRDGGQIAVMYCDLRGFQAVNDQCGVSTGDRVLQEIGRQLENITEGKSATVARWSGDHFVLFYGPVSNTADIDHFAEHLMAMVRQPIRIDEHELRLDFSIGIAVFPDDAEAVDVLTQHAEKALSLAKEQGPGHYEFFVPRLAEAARARQRLEQDLRFAIENGDLELRFQPQLHAGRGQIVGAEALVRWNDPERGQVPPAEFIAIAEQGNLIRPLGDWILATACAEASRWREQGLPNLRISVNVSPAQLHGNNLAERVAEHLDASQLPPALLELEITETTVMADVDGVVAQLERLRTSGIGIAVDDFGTGQSSLGYLKRLPISKVKIDQSFITDVITDPDDAMIVKAIINLGHSLDLTVVAEGVEDSGQYEYLRRQGCDIVQGNFFSAALTSEDFLLYAQRHVKLGT